MISHSHSRLIVEEYQQRLEARLRHKRELMASANAPKTYHELAQAKERNDFQIAEANVAGSALFVGVPPLPSDSPWFSDPVGDEPPLGYSVNDLPSDYASGPPDTFPSGSVAPVRAEALDGAAPTAVPSPTVVETPSKPFVRRF
jgi:hypothetical protein